MKEKTLLLHANLSNKRQSHTSKPGGSSSEAESCTPLPVKACGNLLLHANFHSSNDKRSLCRLFDIMVGSNKHRKPSLQMWHDVLQEDMGYHSSKFDLTCTSVLGKLFKIWQGRHLVAALQARTTDTVKFTLTPIERNSGMF